MGSGEWGRMGVGESGSRGEWEWGRVGVGENGSGGEWENLTLTSYSFFCTFENKGKGMVGESS